MHPVIIDILGVKIYSYGFFVALSIYISYLFIKHQLKEYLNEEKIDKLLFKSLFTGFIGAKLVNVIEHPESYLSEKNLSLDYILSFFSSGFSFFGGFMGISLYIFLYCKREKQHCKKILETFSLAMLLGLSIGKFGCLSAGCCYGKFCSHEFAIIFTDPKSAAPLNIPLWPTQIIESVGYFVLFIISFILTKTTRINTIGFVMVSYSLFRFLVEFIRATTPVVFIFNNIPITWIQVICIILFLIGMYLILYKSKLHAD